MEVPKRIVDVFVAAAASVVSVSGEKGVCVIHICRTPSASAAAIVFTAAAAFVPSMTSPMRSAVDRLEPEFSLVKFSHLFYLVVFLKNLNSRSTTKSGCSSGIKCPEFGTVMP